MTTSTHEVPIVQVKLESHPNADSLSVVTVDGYTVCARTEDWADGQLAAYIPPDSIVKTTRPEFAFLAREGRDVERIKVKKLRGIISMGLLVPAPEGCGVGDDVADLLEVEHYEPAMKILTGDSIPGPSLIVPKYNIDTIRKYHRLLIEDEEICVTEKIHGANARYVYHDDKMWCGSRTQWKAEGSQWHWAIDHHPEVVDFCKEHPDYIVYGEIYGQVQNLKYGLNGVRFVAFDILLGSVWTDSLLFNQICRTKGIPMVPILYVGPYSFAKVEELAEGRSKVVGADNIREGCVVKPTIERIDARIGRIVLKCVGNGYYLHKKM